MAIPETIHLTRREKDDIVQRELARRRKIGESNRGKSQTPETRRKIGEGRKRAWAAQKARAQKAAS